MEMHLSKRPCATRLGFPFSPRNDKNAVEFFRTCCCQCGLDWRARPWLGAPLSFRLCLLLSWCFCFLPSFCLCLLCPVSSSLAVLLCFPLACVSLSAALLRCLHRRGALQAAAPWFAFACGCCCCCRCRPCALLAFCFFSLSLLLLPLCVVGLAVFADCSCCSCFGVAVAVAASSGCCRCCCCRRCCCCCSCVSSSFSLSALPSLLRFLDGLCLCLCRRLCLCVPVVCSLCLCLSVCVCLLPSPAQTFHGWMMLDESRSFLEQGH